MSKERIALVVIIAIMLCAGSFGGGYLLLGNKVESGKQFIYGNSTHKCKVTNILKEGK